MPRRKTGGSQRNHNPELLAKLRAKREGLAFNRMGDAAKMRASKADEGTSEKYAEAFEAVSKMAPGLVSSSKSRKRLEVILSMIDKHGLEDTLKLLKVSDSNLKGALASIFGTSEDNPLADASAPTVDESKLQEAAASFFNKNNESRAVTHEPPLVTSDANAIPEKWPDSEHSMRRKIIPYETMCKSDPLYGSTPLTRDTCEDGGRGPPPQVTPEVAHEPPTDHVSKPVGAHDDTGEGGVEEPQEERSVKEKTIETTMRSRPKIQRFIE